MEIKLAALVPAFNERLVIERTILSLKAAGRNVRDIFVVDDGSTDGTAEIAETLLPKENVLRNPQNMGKAKSVTNALRHFALADHYTHVCFLDADTQLHHGYFKAVRSRIKEQPDVAVICGQPKSIVNNWLTAYRGYQYFLADTVFRPAQSRMRTITVVPGCAATYSAEALTAVQWTGDTLTEDMDVTAQAHLAGLTIVYERNAKVITQDPKTLRGYIGQVNRWNCGAWQVIKKYQLMWRGTKRIHWELRLLFGEGLLFSVMMFLLPMFYFLRAPHQAKERVIYFLATSLLLEGVGAAAAAIREKRWDIVRYIPIYPVMRLIDAALFLRAFWSIVVLRRDFAWFNVERYQQDQDQKGEAVCVKVRSVS